MTIDWYLAMQFASIAGLAAIAGGVITWSFRIGRAPIVVSMDPRGWISLACYSLVLLVFAMMWADHTLLRDDFFKVLATAIVLTAWNGGPVGWAFQGTKSGGELAAQNATIVSEKLAASPPVTKPLNDLGAWGHKLLASIAEAGDEAALATLFEQSKDGIAQASIEIQKVINDAFEARRAIFAPKEV